MMAPPRIMNLLVLSTNLALAQEIQESLAAHGVTVRCASNPGEFFTMLQNFPADMLLLTGAVGLTVCQELRATGSQLPIMLLVDQDDREARITMLDVGASDLVHWPMQANEFLLLIRSQLSRIRTVNDPCLRFQDLSLNLQTREVRRAERVIDLTSKEFDLLKMFLERAQLVLTREQILQEVWGNEFSGESNIIEVYIRYLRLKIEKEGEKKIIQTIRGVGYALRE